MPKTVTGVDVGLRTAKFLRGFWQGNTFHATGFAVTPLASREIAEGWEAAKPPFPPLRARVGLTGRDVNVRYVRVPRVPDWQLRKLMRFEVAEIGDTSGAGVASDFNLLPQLPEIEGEDVVLLAMAREALLEAHAAGLAKAGGKLDAFSPNAIALYNAYVRYGVVQDDTVLIANVGHDNLDVVIARGPDLLFARNLSGGSRLFEEAITQRFGVSPQEAVRIKEEVATLDPNARHPDANAEKASRAILGAAGQLLSLLQSAVLFSKSQVKISGLRLDRVLLCGGGAALAGLPRYLSSGLGVPVELFDPFRVVDVTGLPPEQAALLEQYQLEAVVALGLATMASDPEAWGIEILPAAVQRRRDFVGGKVWLYAAAALAAGYLGWDAWRTTRELDLARSSASELAQLYKRANQTHRKTEELALENERLGALADELQQVRGSGEQLARVLAAVAGELPSDFWLTELSSDWREDPDLRVPRGAARPIVSVAGRAREGTSSLASQYEAFVAGLRAKLPPAAAIKERLNPNGSRFTIDMTLFAPPPAGAPAGDERTASAQENGRPGGTKAER